MKVTLMFVPQAERLLSLGRADEAIALLQSGLTEFPDYATAYILLVEILIQVGDEARAASVARLGVRHCPDNQRLAELAATLPLVSEEVIQELEPPLEVEVPEEQPKYAFPPLPIGMHNSRSSDPRDIAVQHNKPGGQRRRRIKDLEEQRPEPISETPSTPIAPDVVEIDEETLDFLRVAARLVVEGQEKSKTPIGIARTRNPQQADQESEGANSESTDPLDAYIEQLAAAERQSDETMRSELVHDDMHAQQSNDETQNNNDEHHNINAHPLESTDITAFPSDEPGEFTQPGQSIESTFTSQREDLTADEVTTALDTSQDASTASRSLIPATSQGIENGWDAPTQAINARRTEGSGDPDELSESVSDGPPTEDVNEEPGVPQIGAQTESLRESTGQSSVTLISREAAPTRIDDPRRTVLDPFDDFSNPSEESPAKERLSGEIPSEERRSEKRRLEERRSKERYLEARNVVDEQQSIGANHDSEGQEWSPGDSDAPGDGADAAESVGDDLAGGFLTGESEYSVVVATLPVHRNEEKQEYIVLGVELGEEDLRADYLGAIPGLEQLSLPFENLDSRKSRIQWSKFFEPFFAFDPELQRRMEMAPTEDQESLFPRDPKVGQAPRESSGFLGRLEELARNLEGASIPRVVETVVEESPRELLPPIISETLASIYENQGAYSQAIEEYRRLEAADPARSDEFRSKINRLLLLQRGKRL